MELASLIDALSEPAAYPYAVSDVEIRQTHISVVFLAGPYAYKIKKPVELGFLDFNTLENRLHFCKEEVRLNSRLAPKVYLGVAPVTRHGEGVRFEGAGPVVEWAVKMERLPDDAILEYCLRRGQVGAEVIEALARKIARFHAEADSGPHITACGTFKVVSRNARDNFNQSADQIGTTISQSVFDRLKALTEESLERQHALISARAERGVPRDTHGDLRLGHVYLLPDHKPPDIIIIDCIEFNESLRFADPIADMAFLVMELKYHGWPQLARAFVEAYFQASGDEEGRKLVSFYTAYRAAVRGKVEGFKQMQDEVPEADRAVALTMSLGYWLLALGELEPPEKKPCLLLVGGLPGTGKSTLAADLAEQCGFSVIRTDVVRKELAEAAGVSVGPAPFGSGIYSREWSERTYAECLKRAEKMLFEGKRVLVDASFREETTRQIFLKAAARWKVSGLFLLCQVSDDIAKERLGRRVHDASDADWSTHLQAAKAWEAPSPATLSALRPITAAGGRQHAYAQAAKILRQADLWT